MALWCTSWLFESKELISAMDWLGGTFWDGGKLSVRLWGERRAVDAIAQAMLGLLISMAFESSCR